MTRSATDDQVENLTSGATRPIIIVCWEHSGAQELISCTGRVEYDGEIYQPGILQIVSIQENRSAVFSMPATKQRLSEVNNSTWRRGVCKIWQIPANSSDTAGYSVTDSIMLLDGVIDSSRMSQNNQITVSAVHKNLDGNNTPRNTLNEIASNLPSAGSVLVWEDDTIVLEAPR